MAAKQLQLLPKSESSYGGKLRSTRKSRAMPRPLAVRKTMHLVLKSSLARGEWSLRRHRGRIDSITKTFAARYAVKVLKYANVGNHLHVHFQLSNRHNYAAFIRGWTAALAMAVTGASRWHRPEALKSRGFWDNRPFTRVVTTFREFTILNRYIVKNQVEGEGIPREAVELFYRKVTEFKKRIFRKFVKS
jgi:hypothetical protein